MLTLLQRQTRHSPVVVGEHYELAETVAAAYSGELLGAGLLAKSADSTALLSMSGYEKSHNAHLNDYSSKRSIQSYSDIPDYNASRSQQDPMYLAYSLPGFTNPNLQAQPGTYNRSSDQISYGANSTYQPRASYDQTNPTYGQYQSRKLPILSSYSPNKGNQGSHVFVYINSSTDLLAPSPIVASLMFAARRVLASLTRLDSREEDVYYKYVVTANAPVFADTRSTQARVTLRLQLQEASGLDAGLIDVGPWLYDDGKQYEHISPIESSRKRKSSEELNHSAKRSATPQDYAIESRDYGAYPFSSTPGLAYTQSLHSVNSNNMQRKLTPYGKAQSQNGLQNESSSAYSQSLMKPPHAHTSSWSPSYASTYRPGKPSNQSYVPTTASPSPSNPPLVRASTLQTQPGSASTSGASSDGGFNPYALYPNRANIKIRGDLNTMQDDWTTEERSAMRRLVLFRGEQAGSTINTYFRPIKADERPSPHATRERRVSCIYWEERQEYFVTSVDTIALLETLVGARFTVEEKNRIRRNLETHHPLTVSKAKSDTENFFKVIMGFPNPKPRNIEKDVKVFPWPILAQALRKVISKYSASHASTAGPLPRPQNHYYTTSRSDTGTISDLYGDVSSRPASSASSVYAQTLKSATVSPPNASAGLTYTQASPMHPAISHAYTVPTLASQHISTNDLSTAYNTQVSSPDLSQAYTASSTGRRRSSEAVPDTQNTIQYPALTRPRAQTSFAALYAMPENPAEYSLQLPTAGQPVRGSWDFSSYLQPGANISESPTALQRPTEAGANEEGEMEENA